MAITAADVIEVARLYHPVLDERVLPGKVAIQLLNSIQNNLIQEVRERDPWYLVMDSAPLAPPANTETLVFFGPDQVIVGGKVNFNIASLPPARLRLINYGDRLNPGVPYAIANRFGEIRFCEPSYQWRDVANIVLEYLAHQNLSGTTDVLALPATARDAMALQLAVYGLGRAKAMGLVTDSDLDVRGMLQDARTSFLETVAKAGRPRSTRIRQVV